MHPTLQKMLQGSGKGLLQGNLTVVGTPIGISDASTHFSCLVGPSRCLSFYSTGSNIVCTTFETNGAGVSSVDSGHTFPSPFHNTPFIEYLSPNRVVVASRSGTMPVAVVLGVFEFDGSDWAQVGSNSDVINIAGATILRNLFYVEDNRIILEGNVTSGDLIELLFDDNTEEWDIVFTTVSPFSGSTPLLGIVGEDKIVTALLVSSVYDDIQLRLRDGVTGEIDIISATPVIETDGTNDRAQNIALIANNQFLWCRYDGGIVPELYRVLPTEPETIERTKVGGIISLPTAAIRVLKTHVMSAYAQHIMCFYRTSASQGRVALMKIT